MSDEWLTVKDVPGFARQKLEVKLPGLVKGAHLRVNGQTPPPGRRRGEYTLKSDDGRMVTARFRNQVFGLDVPQLEVGSKTIDILPPLRWYFWLWASIPFLLVTFGGLLGGLIGAIAMWFNIRLLRASSHVAIRLATTLGVTLLAVVIWFCIYTLIYQD